MNTTLNQILKDIGDVKLDINSQIPVLISGLEKNRFNIEHKKEHFQQIALVAYKMIDRDMVERYKLSLKNELGLSNTKFFLYPYDDEGELISIIGQLSNHFGNVIDPAQVISKEQNATKDFWCYYLFVILIPSFYYA